MCQSWNSKMLSCTSDLVQQPKDATPSDQQSCKFSASTTNATDIYKRLCIIYFCDEIETTQVASITFSKDGVRLVNLIASAGEEGLPTSVFLSRSMFVIYNFYPAEGERDVQILVNFSTLMDFLECALAKVTQEDEDNPLHFVLDNWLYVSLQQSPTICDLDKAMSTSLATTRFCLIPTECLSGSVEEHTVPSGDHAMPESEEMMDNTILMLHPLNPRLLDPSCLVPKTTTPALSKSFKQPARTSSRPHRVPQTPTTPSTPTTPVTPCTPVPSPRADDEEPSRKRLKTTADQIGMLEEWFQREPLPTRKVREELVLKLEGAISLRQLEVWFQNRRAKQKKADARAQRGRAGEVPSATPNSSPFPSSTPPSSPFPPPSPSSPLATPPSFHGMAPNPGTLIPSISPSVTPRKPSKPSPKRTKYNSQGTSVPSSPLPSSPLPPTTSPLPPPASPSIPAKSTGSISQ